MLLGKDKGENVSFTFKEGLLHIVEQEASMHGERSRILYGRLEDYTSSDGESIRLQQFAYILPLEDLKKIKKFGFLKGYVTLNDYTKARRTITGGLEIKRVRNYIERLISQAHFSRGEWKTIEKYL